MNVNMTIGIGDGLLYSLLGLLVVFFALFLLMCIIKLMWVFEKKEQPAAPAAASAAATAPAPAAVPAPAPAGEPHCLSYRLFRGGYDPCPDFFLPAGPSSG